jgi:glutamate-1-semialdehyde aminotransferase
VEEFIKRYEAHSPKSRALYERARSVLPGGTTRTSVFYAPYPLYIERGEGCRVWDADGRERVDFNGNATSQVHGHGNPDVIEASVARRSGGSPLARRRGRRCVWRKSCVNAFHRWSRCGSRVRARRR